MSRGAWGLLAGLIALVMSGFALGAWWLHDRHATYEWLIDREEQRIARLMGYIEVRDEIAEAREQAQAVIGGLGVVSDEDAGAVGGALQQDVRQQAIETGLSVVRSQLLPPVQEQDLNLVSVEMVLTGNLEAVHVFLGRLAQFRPRLKLDALSISSNGSPDEVRNQMLGVTLRVSMIHWSRE
ncbi:MAG: type II secretion system protein GspM [Halothiobacillaceae bacterium]